MEDIYPGDPRFDPWFEEMNRRKVTLFMHPTVARASLAVDLKIDISMLEFMFDTTRMLTNMVFTGAKRRFSDIRMISTHAGGTIPYLVTRLQTLELTDVRTRSSSDASYCRRGQGGICVLLLRSHCWYLSGAVRCNQ